MAKVFLATVLLSSILAVSGCVGGLPNIGALGAALGSIPSYGGGQQSYGGGQPYTYDPGAGGGYAQGGQPYYQQGQPYYQPQPYAYSGNPEVYNQPVPQATEGYAAPAPGSWSDRRRQHREDRIQQGLASGQLAPDEGNRLRAHQGRFGGVAGQMGPNGNPNPQEQGHFNAMQPGSSQDTYGQRHHGVQTGDVPPGPTAQSGPTGPLRPMAQLGPGGQPRATMQPRTSMQPRPAPLRRPTSQPRQNRYNGSAI